MPAALIVEDHPLYRDALSQLLARDFEVNAVASAEEALKLANPGLRLILLDPGLPGIKGAEAVNALRRQCPDAVLLVISASEDRREAMAAFRAGDPVSAYRENLFERARRLALRHSTPILLVLAYLLMRLTFLAVFGR